ncbi:endolytic transglycosylase MltG [Streptomyces sp. SID10815]|uniref:endolytic transglycosylase MltG n=1 Tax=Streptomyces sp. SID10815 TaxID=2706027 RepID=UPI0013C751EE|nr:endolytic transglycosylase MltG [Streptomyces sp. SID10815]NEA48123.1 endolytic transglycosylase MltG [Streptomyces sp. SID10815]
MTEYGRGPGSEPWHPEDPLYGDGGWGEQQGRPAPQPPYGGLPQHHPQQPQHPQQYGDWGHEQQPGYDQQYPQHYDPQAQHHGHQPQHPEHHGHQPQHPEQHGHHGHHPYDPQYGAHLQDQHQQQAGWGGAAGHQQPPYAADPVDPYGQQAAAYGAEQPDLYGTPEAYPPPEPPNRRTAEPEPRPDWDPEQEGDQDEDHAFFAGGDDDGADEDDAPGAGEPGGGRGRAGRKGRGGKGKSGKKRRNGCACLVVVLVFGGGAAGVAYYGYQFYQNRFGAAPDYAGNGTGETVTVEIPQGAVGYDIGRALKKAGVVKSVDAFVSAQSNNPQGKQIQAGAYLLKKEMSAASAVAMMLDPTSQSSVLVKPGERNAEVYQAIDKQLRLSAGTTKNIAAKQYKSLGLPSWADGNGQIMDPLEGFLYPGTYPAAKGMKPDMVLRAMVKQAGEAYKRYDVTAKAKQFDLADPLEFVTLASLVQAEGKTHDDFRAMAEVIYNRLKPTNTETNQLLQFDSTYNYLKGESNIHIAEKDVHGNQSPYNTYTHKGLPPGPIGNPGEDALKAAMNPTDEGWLYFVATDGMNKTEFAKNLADFNKLKEKFNASSGH